MSLISKKDLLAVTGISYGQLYRWKRQGLIPEEWFIKQSSYTGQETFLPREQAISRINSILELKDSHSIEELVKIFSPQSADLSISADTLAKITELPSGISGRLSSVLHTEKIYFKDLIYAVSVMKLARKCNLSDIEAERIMEQGADAYKGVKGLSFTLSLFEAANTFYLAVTKENILYLDSKANIKAQTSMEENADKIKTKYNQLF